jgi:predicted aspartyl protease
LNLRIERGLLFAQITIFHAGQPLTLERVLVDTGSAGTIFQTAVLQRIGIEYSPDDEMHRIRGIGGTEFVFSKRLDRVQIGDLSVSDLSVEVGWMDYGFELHGILGLDFLRKSAALIDLAALELRKANAT